MAFITAVKLKAFKSVGSDWLEVHFGRGLNAVVGAPYWLSGQFASCGERDRAAGTVFAASRNVI